MTNRRICKHSTVLGFIDFTYKTPVSLQICFKWIILTGYLQEKSKIGKTVLFVLEYIIVWKS